MSFDDELRRKVEGPPLGSMAAGLPLAWNACHASGSARGSLSSQGTNPSATPLARRSFRFSSCVDGSGRGSLNDNHPVLLAMLQELRQLRHRYASEPCDLNRYQLVRQETRVLQVRPDLVASA